MFLAGIGGLGAPELMIILAVVVVLFGASRLAGLGGALGQSIREFRRTSRDPEEEERKRLEDERKRLDESGRFAAQSAPPATNGSTVRELRPNDSGTAPTPGVRPPDFTGR